MTLMLLICSYGVCLFMGLLCATLLWFIWSDKIDLTRLIAEANGSASMSRFQLLIFTFVVAISLFMMTVRTGSFPQIPDGVLVLLGISASTYAVGKGISYSRDEGVTTPQERQDTRYVAETISATGAATIATAAGIASSGASNTEN
ncbi:hypothetical protein [Terriglobus roseus]|uniref:Uncharacterized protein n=1 Tax=Terriglobus roseus TaxID=392734 RepID=A0A1H4IW65_9BACT|nr:hypothetical protein [Terriglobus roseus]SEB37538.1 hypothetical protein SAMN05443244_0077 [Terriglobus roseus]